LIVSGGCKFSKSTALFIITLSALACGPAALAAPNILLIIGDDMGTDTMASYGLSENPPSTPNIDEMAQQGVRYTGFWSQPVCSPTRATIVSGRYGFRTGVGRPVTTSGPVPEPPAPAANGGGGGGGGANANPLRSLARNGLGSDEYALPLAFADSGSDYATAAIGKWHLADAENGWLSHTNLVGFDYFAGGWGGSTETYSTWNKVINGEVTSIEGCAPTDKVDEFFGSFAGVETANYAIRGTRYKLLRAGGAEEFYDLEAAPWEQQNLLLEETMSATEHAAHQSLMDSLTELRNDR